MSCQLKCALTYTKLVVVITLKCRLFVRVPEDAAIADLSHLHHLFNTLDQVSPPWWVPNLYDLPILISRVRL
jgi:hypothetical protein